MPGPSFDVRVLGRFAVLRDGDEVPAAAFGGRLSRRLVRVLIARRGEHVPKDVLAEALWPLRAPSDPGSNLEVLVSRARRALGDPSLLLTGPGGYAFSTEERCRVDAEELLRSVDGGLARARAGENAAALAEFDRAVSLWGGEPFAEDLYEDWAEPFRARLRDALQVALEAGAAAALEAGDPRSALALAAQAASREPLRESAAVLHVRALAAGGDRAGALEAYERFRVRLAEELGLDPSEETAALLAKVLRGETLAPAPAPPDLAAVSGTELPFSGREAELATALGASERVVLVTGSSGSGKTRFLDELARRAEVPVVRAAAVPPERDEPWGLARSLLREALALDALAARSLPRLSVVALGDVLPELAEADESRSVSVDRESRRALATEGARLLLEAAAGPGALVLVDDLQWADGTSLHLLAVAAARVPALRLVLAVRSEEAAPSSPAAAFLGDLRQAGGARTIELGPLPEDALERATGDAGVAAAIAAETAATPLVAVEAVRLLEDRGLIGADASGRRRPTRPITPEEARDAARSAERSRAAARLARLDRRGAGRARRARRARPGGAGGDARRGPRPRAGGGPRVARPARAGGVRAARRARMDRRRTTPSPRWSRPASSPDGGCACRAPWRARSRPRAPSPPRSRATWSRPATSREPSNATPGRPSWRSRGSRTRRAGASPTRRSGSSRRPGREPGCSRSGPSRWPGRATSTRPSATCAMRSRRPRRTRSGPTCCGGSPCSRAARRTTRPRGGWWSWPSRPPARIPVAGPRRTRWARSST